MRWRRHCEIAVSLRATKKYARLVARQLGILRTPPYAPAAGLLTRGLAEDLRPRQSPWFSDPTSHRHLSGRVALSRTYLLISVRARECSRFSGDNPWVSLVSFAAPDVQDPATGSCPELRTQPLLSAFLAGPRDAFILLPVKAEMSLPPALCGRRVPRSRELPERPVLIIPRMTTSLRLVLLIRTPASLLALAPHRRSDFTVIA